MCLIAVAFAASRRHRLLVAANRDEDHQRPTLAAHWWNNMPIFGGRDLVAGGTWLAVDASGRLGAVTNFREARAAPPSPRSRGLLINDYLTGTDSSGRFAAALERQGERYAAFNLLLFEGDTLHYASNRAESRALGPGVYALSNAPFAAAWPKVHWAERAMRSALALSDPTESLFGLLAERRAVHGAGPPTEASPFAATPFILGERYGTRCSTVVTLTSAGELELIERRFDFAGHLVGESRERFMTAPTAGKEGAPRSGATRARRASD